jgi:Ca2+-binding EF-hand superfamily protein
LRNAFAKFDMLDNGKVNKDYLINCLGKYGEKLSIEEIDEIVQCAQLQRSAEIDIDYFVKTICGSLDDE